MLSADPASDGGAPLTIAASWPARLPLSHRQRDSHHDLGSAEEVLGLLRHVPFFSGCDEQEIQYVLRTARLRHVPRYEVLIRQGTYGVTFFMLLEGELHCFNEKGVDVRLNRPGDVLGEGALVARCPRAANVVASCNCRVLCWQVGRHPRPWPLGSHRPACAAYTLTRSRRRAVVQAEQLQGLRIDRNAAKVTVITHALEDLPFFCNLVPQQLKAMPARGTGRPPGLRTAPHLPP